MADWKQLELFEKEAAALHSLSHPGIPAYKDYFEVDSDGDRAYFLVQVSHQTYYSELAPSIYAQIHLHNQLYAQIHLHTQLYDVDVAY